MNEEAQQKQGFFAKKANRLLVIIAGLFLALGAATYGGMHYTSQTSFCNSCHIMNPYYSSWASSSHKGTHCYDCHIEEGTVNYMKAKVNGLRELYITVAGDVTTPGKDEKAWDKCQKCHAKILAASSQATDSFEHYKHIQKGLNCKQCHGDLVHGKQVTDFKPLCIDCHKNKVVTPDSHKKPEFKVTHGQAYLKNQNGCEICHSDGQSKQMCQSCHGLTMPHPQGFVNQHTAEAKGAAAKTCANCHLNAPDNLPRKAQSCQSCHGVSLPHPQDYLTAHGKVVKSQGDKTCLNCHKEQPADQNRLAKSCSSCHGITMPHPANFQSQHASAIKTSGTQVCLNCHKSDGKPRQAQSCEKCHGVPLPHPGDYLVKHTATVAAKGTKACLNCHGSKPSPSTVSCQKCHGVTMPHPAGYQASHTSVVASQGTQACLKCHKDDKLPRKADTCTSCHGVTMPHAASYITSHTAEAQSKGTALCLKCHNGGTGLKAGTCISCHKVQMPHPASWSTTHGKSGDLKNCAYCHSPSNPVNPKASWANQNFCSNCHSQKPHGDNFITGHQKAEIDVTSCKKCHDYKSYCAKCHS